MDDSALRGRRILVLEDEPLIGLDIRMNLEDQGAHVVYARNLKMGLEAVEGDLDLALLDVNLGRNETCVPVANRLSERGIPFALHSGDLERAGDTVLSLDAPLVPKPSHMREIVTALSALARDLD